MKNFEGDTEDALSGPLTALFAAKYGISDFMNATDVRTLKRDLQMHRE